MIKSQPPCRNLSPCGWSSTVSGPGLSLRPGPYAPWHLPSQLQSCLPTLRWEVCLSGPAVVPGYWRREAETAKAFAGGELRTGDVGIMDDEGWLYKPTTQITAD